MMDAVSVATLRALVATRAVERFVWNHLEGCDGRYCDAGCRAGDVGYRVAPDYIKALEEG